MPAIALGRYWRYDLDDITAWVEQCKQPGRAITFRTTNPTRGAKCAPTT
jgi:hypothetical protein